MHLGGVDRGRPKGHHARIHARPPGKFWAANLSVVGPPFIRCMSPCAFYVRERNSALQQSLVRIRTRIRRSSSRSPPPLTGCCPARAKRGHLQAGALAQQIVGEKRTPQAIFGSCICLRNQTSSNNRDRAFFPRRKQDLLCDAIFSTPGLTSTSSPPCPGRAATSPGWTALLPRRST